MVAGLKNAGAAQTGGAHSLHLPLRPPLHPLQLHPGPPTPGV